MAKAARRGDAVFEFKLLGLRGLEDWMWNGMSARGGGRRHCWADMGKGSVRVWRGMGGHAAGRGMGRFGHGRVGAAVYLRNLWAVEDEEDMQPRMMEVATRTKVATR